MCGSSLISRNISNLEVLFYSMDSDYCRGHRFSLPSISRAVNQINYDYIAMGVLFRMFSGILTRWEAPPIPVHIKEISTAGWEMMRKCKRTQPILPSSFSVALNLPDVVLLCSKDSSCLSFILAAMVKNFQGNSRFH